MRIVQFNLAESVEKMMSRRLSNTYFLNILKVMLLLCLANVGGMAMADDMALPHTLEDIDFSALPGNKVQIKLTLTGSGPVSEPLSFTIDNPARIALDFAGTNSTVPKRQMVGIGVARSINAIESKGRTRVILNLDRLVPYVTRIENNEVFIVLEGETVDVAAAAVPVSEQENASTMVQDDSQHAIQNIDFRRGEEGQARIIISMSDAKISINVSEEAGKIAIDFVDTRLPEELEQRLDVIDFATPVSFIDSFTQGGNVRIEVVTSGDYEQLAYQTNDKYTLEIKPLTKKEKEAAAKDIFGYTGEKLSLNFQDIEIRAVLQLIADFTNMNMVTSDTVTGNVTLRLQNVPWDQALDIILKSKGLAVRRSGNVMLVAPSEEIATREKQEFESQMQVEELAPLRTELIQVNYAKAEEIASLLKAEGTSLLSERGNVSIDERTNTLLVQDTLVKLSEIRVLVNNLDIPVRQVLIESRVVIANDNFSRDLGVRFGATGVSQSGSNTIGVSGSLSGTDTIISGAPIPVSVPGLSNRLNVNLPVIGPAGQFAVSVLGSDFLMDLELSAMQAEGDGEVVSSPRVITSNQSEAFIEQGVEIPYQEASSSGATSVSFKSAVLSLKVTPQITPDDRVILDLTVNKDSVGEVFQGVPSINTREVKTQVLVDNGETVVLGGIYEQISSNEIDKVPFLGDIPFLGALFRQSRKVDDKAELLIFVTPKILKESLSAR